jgi:ribosome-binding protein aMBF1 (putative translation factor)
VRVKEKKIIKSCEMCGRDFKANTSHNKFCKDCLIVRAKEKAREYSRANRENYKSSYDQKILRA